MQDDMLLVEDLMLLLLDDDSGVPAGAGTLYYTLGGAMLVDLALRGAVEIDESRTGAAGPKVLAVARGALPDPLLQSAYEKVAEKPRGVQTLLITIGTSMGDHVIDRLVERGVLRREAKKVLRIFNTTRLEVDDERHEATLRRDVRAALEGTAIPDARTAGIIALLSASNTLVLIRPALTKLTGDVYKRAKELEQGHWGAEAVTTAVTRTAVAIAASTVIAITTTTAAQ